MAAAPLPDRRDALRAACVRETNRPSSPTAAGAAAPQPEVIDAGDAADIAAAPARTSSASPSGAASTQRVDGAPAEAVAGDGDEHRDADRRQRVRARIAGARRDQARQHQPRGDEIAGIMQRVGRQRVAAGLPATLSSARQRKMSTTIEIEHRGEGEAVGGDVRRLRRGAGAPATATPTASAIRKPVSASAATASTLAWPNGWPSSAGLSATRTAK